jgi:HPt (histidine-containing phosphotransfer) domain-containing protein
MKRMGKPVFNGEVLLCGEAAAENQPAESDEKFRERLIQHFISDNKNKYEEIVSAVKAGDIKLANRLAHNLKSNAGHLGQTGLQKAAEDVEKLLQDKNSLVTPPELHALKVELDAALKEFSVRETEKPGHAAAPRVSIDAEGKQVLINKLEPLLEGGNPECLSLIDDLRAMPGSEALIEQMERFNFDAALEVLKYWRS